MRAAISRRLDVVVVIWVLTLAVGWCAIAMSRTTLPADHWSTAPQSGPVWMVDNQPGY